jgi:hypothetical protein
MLRRSAVAGLLAAAFSAAPALAQQKVEVQFWHAMSGVLGERVDEIVKRFNASQDKYTVVATYKGNYDEVINATIAAYRAKKAPQIVQIYERGFMSMLLSGAIVPVQDLLTEKKKNVDFGGLRQAGGELLPVQGQADEHALQFLDADPVLQQGAVREGGLQGAGRYLGRVREAALHHQAEGRGRVRLVPGRRLLLEPDGELQHGERPAVGHEIQRL